MEIYIDPHRYKIIKKDNITSEKFLLNLLSILIFPH